MRFHVPAERPEHIAFAYSPTLEAVLSLHVLTGPKHHALQHEWVRRARRLPRTCAAGSARSPSPTRE